MSTYSLLDGIPIKIEARKQESAFLSKMYKQSMPFVEHNSRAFHSIVGVESGVRLSEQQMVPWHMPTPAELSSERVRLDGEKDTLESDEEEAHIQDISLCADASPTPTYRTTKGRLNVFGEALTYPAPGAFAPTNVMPNPHLPSSHPANGSLARSLHARYMARQTGNNMPINPTFRQVMQTKDTNRALHFGPPSNPNIPGHPTLNKAREQLKRKFQDFEPLAGSGIGDGRYKIAAVPGIVANPPQPPKLRQKPHQMNKTFTQMEQQPKTQSLRRGHQSCMPPTQGSRPYKQVIKHPVQNLAGTSRTRASLLVQPPKGSPMPPLELVLQSGFRDAHPPAPHTYMPIFHQPKTRLALEHKSLNPRPVFMSSATTDSIYNESPQSDLSDYSESEQEPAAQARAHWTPSLSKTLSTHIRNPLVLFEQTNLEAVVFGRSKDALLTHPRKWSRMEGPNNGTTCRLLRLCLPSPISASTEEALHTDWLILQLIRAPRSKPRKNPPPRSAAPSFGSTNTYLVIAFPVPAITTQKPASSAIWVEKIKCKATQLRFAGVGRLPLLHGVDRDGQDLRLWIQAFGRGEAVLELFYTDQETECWV